MKPLLQTLRFQPLSIKYIIVKISVSYWLTTKTVSSNINNSALVWILNEAFLLVRFRYYIIVTVNIHCWIFVLFYIPRTPMHKTKLYVLHLYSVEFTVEPSFVRFQFQATTVVICIPSCFNYYCEIWNFHFSRGFWHFWNY